MPGFPGGYLPGVPTPMPPMGPPMSGPGSMGDCSWDVNTGCGTGTYNPQGGNCGGPCWNGLHDYAFGRQDSSGCGLCAVGGYPNQCSVGFYDLAYDTCPCPYGYGWV